MTFVCNGNKLIEMLCLVELHLKQSPASQGKFRSAVKRIQIGHVTRAAVTESTNGAGVYGLYSVLCTLGPPQQVHKYIIRSFGVRPACLFKAHLARIQGS